MSRVASPDSRLDRRHAGAPALLGARPREVGCREVELVEREHQHEIVCLTRLELEHERQLAGGLRSRAGATEPREADLAAAARPRPALGASEVARRLVAEAAAWVQHDIESRRSLARDDPAQNDRTIRARGQGERLAGLDDRVLLGHPAAPPDEASGLVVAAPDVSADRRDGVFATGADQRREDCVVVPPGKAHPREVTARADEDAALAVCEQRVLAQDMWR